MAHILRTICHELGRPKDRFRNVTACMQILEGHVLSIYVRVIRM